MNTKNVTSVIRSAYRSMAIMILCVLFSASLIAYAASQYVYDQAGLLTSQQQQTLEEKAAAAADKMNMDVVVVTTNDANGKSAEAYADDFFEQNGFGIGNDKNGVLFLIDMDNRELQISTSGAMIRFLTDSRINSMLDNAYVYLQQGDYNQAFEQLITDTENYYEDGIVSGQYNYDRETGKISVHRSVKWYEALLSLGVSLFCAVGACGKVQSEYAMKAAKEQAANYLMAYRATSQFKFNNKLDELADKSTTQRLIGPVVTGRPGGFGGSGGMGGGGMSTTHRSSGGGMHGGGGRKF